MLSRETLEVSTARRNQIGEIARTSHQRVQLRPERRHPQRVRGRVMEVLATPGQCCRRRRPCLVRLKDPDTTLTSDLLLPDCRRKKIQPACASR